MFIILYTQEMPNIISLYQYIPISSAQERGCNNMNKNNQNSRQLLNELKKQNGNILK